MKAVIVVLLAVCAHGQGTSTGVKVEVNRNELVYTTAEQEIYRIAYLNPGYSMLWHDAQLECLEAGYKGLLSIKSSAAQQAVDYALVSLGVSGSAWIGVHRETPSDTWTWADGTALGDYTNWRSNPSSTVIGAGSVYPPGSSYFRKWTHSHPTIMFPCCLCEF